MKFIFLYVFAPTMSHLSEIELDFICKCLSELPVCDEKNFDKDLDISWREIQTEIFVEEKSEVFQIISKPTFELSALYSYMYMNAIPIMEYLRDMDESMTEKDVVEKAFFEVFMDKDRVMQFFKLSAYLYCISYLCHEKILDYEMMKPYTEEVREFFIKFPESVYAKINKEALIERFSAKPEEKELMDKYLTEEEFKKLHVWISMKIETKYGKE